MYVKTFIRMLALMLALVVCPCVMVTAANIHSPGPLTYELDRGYLLEQSAAELSGDNLVIQAGGSMKFDLLLPFDSDKLEISYRAEADCKLTITTDERSYTA